MKNQYANLLAAMAFFAVVLAGCAPDESGAPAGSAPASDTAAAAAEPEPGDAASEPNASELAGTEWRLVRIMEMDDSTHTPGDRSLYTLEFGADGTVSIRADCNRGSGTWASESGGQLTFGPIAATLAECGPGSIASTYLAQFAWVRSYVLRDGHLFLATMADGSIIEFEPADSASPMATLLGEDVETADAGQLRELIITALFDRYAADNGIEALDEEIDAFVQDMERGMAADPNLDAEDGLTPEERGQVAEMRRDMGRVMIRQWKLNKALYEQYGGRIIYQQMGPEPLDAYREFLEERQQAGDFTIKDAAIAADFWSYFTDESRHTFMEPGSEDEARAFRAPPWEVSAGSE